MKYSFIIRSYLQYLIIYAITENSELNYSISDPNQVSRLMF